MNQIGPGAPRVDKVALHPRSSVVEHPERRRRVTEQIATWLGAPPALELTSSCTHALEAAAAVLCIGPGDEVIVPAFTFPSTANPFVLRGAAVRFGDVDPRTANLDPASVEQRATDRTRAVVVTHYGGVGSGLDRLVELCDERGWWLVEDAAHGLFASVDGIPLGRFGTFGALSFHHTKNLSAGDGGALVVNRPEHVPAARVALDKGTNRVDFEAGHVRSYEWTGPGSAWRMPAAQVAALRSQLEGAEAIQRRRHLIWQTYAFELSTWAERTGVQLPAVPVGVQHPAHLFWLLLPDTVPRERFVDWCVGRGVQTAQHYGSLASSRFGLELGDGRDDCPIAEAFGRQLVRLPLHHELSDDDVARVLEAVTTFS